MLTFACVCACLYLGDCPRHYSKERQLDAPQDIWLPKHATYTEKLFEIQVEVLPLCEGIPGCSHVCQGLDDLGGRHHEGSQGL